MALSQASHSAAKLSAIASVSSLVVMVLVVLIIGALTGDYSHVLSTSANLVHAEHRMNGPFALPASCQWVCYCSASVYPRS